MATFDGSSEYGDMAAGELLILNDTTSGCSVTGCRGVVVPLKTDTPPPLLSIPLLAHLAVEKVAIQLVQVIKDEFFNISANHKAVGAWLCKLTPQTLDAVIWRVQEIRPPWIPIDLHWVEIEPDPLLLLLAYATKLQTLSYSIVPQALPTLQALLVGLPYLSTLELRQTANDVLLRSVGRSCPSLKVLCVQGSRCVSDAGVRYLVLRPMASSRCAWKALYRRWKEVRRMTSATTSGATIGGSQQQYQLLVPPVPGPHQLTDLTRVLLHLDLRGTRVTSDAATWAARCLPQAHLLLLASTATCLDRNKRYHSLEDQCITPSSTRSRLPSSP